MALMAVKNLVTWTRETGWVASWGTWLLVVSGLLLTGCGGGGAGGKAGGTRDGQRASAPEPAASVGTIAVSSPAFDEGGQAHYAGRDVAALLRLDDAGTLTFAREGERATPVRMLQIPLTPADGHGPVLLAMLDEEMGPADRGAAQTYVETLLSLLPFGLALVDRDGRFLYMNRAFVRAAGIGEGRPPRYPGDLDFDPGRPR